MFIQYCQRFVVVVVVLSMTSFVLMACGTGQGETAAEGVVGEQAGGRGEGEIEGGPIVPTLTDGPQAPACEGLGLDSLSAYAASFEMTFVAGDDASLTWTYTLDILAGGQPPGIRCSLSLGGVPSEQDLGDITLTLIGDTQYMTGEAVGELGCLVFPATVDMGTSFLTPEDFLSLSVLSDVLTPTGEETVAGQDGTLYTFEVDTLADFTNVSGEIVLAQDDNYVLRYDFTGNTVDTRFSGGQEGQMTWHFEITDLAPAETVGVPDGCEINYPIMSDATSLARLPGLITYNSSSSREDVQAFYEEALPAEGWERYDLPATSEDTTILTYARTGELLDISITRAEGGSEVQLFLQE